MPSGAKKRKQAKKKKEQQAYSNSNNSSSISDTHSQGNDDPKSQDERDSDGGELGSPASQDHPNQHRPFNEENEESEKPVRSSFATEDVEGSQNNLAENQNGVEIQREVNLEQDTGTVDVKVEHIEFSKPIDDKSSSSSSSDDESLPSDEKRKVESHYSASDAISCDTVEKAQEVKEDSTIEKEVTKANGNSVTESAPAMDWDTPVVRISDVAAKLVTEGAQSQNVEVLEVFESEFEDKLLPTSDVIASLVPEENEEKVIPILNQNAGATNVNGNEDKLPKSSSSHTRYAESVKDFEASDSTAIKNEVETSASSVVHTSEAVKDVKKAKDFEPSENIETQPLVPPAPRIAQRTSVLSCCGLFDVFTGSSR